MLIPSTWTFPCSGSLLRRLFSSTVSSSIKQNIQVKEKKIEPFQIQKALDKIQSQHPNVYAKLLIYNFPFTVVRTDLIVTHRLKNVQIGDIIELDNVREVGSTDFKLRGLPLLPNGAVRVKATVMEHTFGEKKRARMRKQRKGRRPMRTIKPLVTTLRIQDIIINSNPHADQQNC